MSHRNRPIDQAAGLPRPSAIFLRPGLKYAYRASRKLRAARDKYRPLR